ARAARPCPILDRRLPLTWRWPGRRSAGLFFHLGLGAVVPVGPEAGLVGVAAEADVDVVAAAAAGILDREAGRRGGPQEAGGAVLEADADRAAGQVVGPVLGGPGRGRSGRRRRAGRRARRRGRGRSATGRLGATRRPRTGGGGGRGGDRRPARRRGRGA